MFGRLFHVGLDLLLISTVLAGIKRSTGLAPDVKRIPGRDLRQLAITYLELGEWTTDLCIVVMGRSNYFARNR